MTTLVNDNSQSSLTLDTKQVPSLHVSSFPGAFTTEVNRLAQTFIKSPPTIPIIQAAIRTNNIVTLTAVVVYVLDQKPQFISLPLGSRFGFDDIQTLLGINQGYIPLSIEYTLPFTAITTGTIELLDFVRILRSSINWTGTHFLNAIASSPVFKFQNELRDQWKFIEQRPKQQILHARLYYLAFGHGEDSLWYWLSPCDITYSKIVDLVTRVLDLSIQEYNTIVCDIYAKIATTAMESFNFPLLAALVVRQCPRLIEDERPLLFGEEASIKPWKFPTGYDYSTNDKMLDINQDSKKTKKKKSNTAKNNTQIDPNTNQDALLDEIPVQLEPYRVEPELINTIYKQAPLLCYVYSFHLSRILNKLRDAIDSTPPTPYPSPDEDPQDEAPVDTDGQPIGEQQQKQKKKNSPTYLLPNHHITTGLQIELEHVRNLMTIVGQFFQQTIAFFGWNCWPARTYHILWLVAEHFGDTRMTQKLQAIGMNQDNIYTAYLHLQAQLLTSTCPFKTEFIIAMEADKGQHSADDDQNAADESSIDLPFSSFGSTPTSPNSLTLKPFKFAHDFLLAQAVEQFIIYDFTPLVDLVISKSSHSTVGELITAASARFSAGSTDGKAPDAPFLAIALAEDIHLDTVKYLIKQKVKVCSNYLQGLQANVIHAIVTKCQSEELMLERLHYFFGFFQRNTKFKPNYKTQDFLTAIQTQIRFVLTSLHDYKFPSQVFELLFNLIDPDALANVDSFAEMVFQFFQGKDSFFAKSVEAISSQYYMCPTHEPFKLRITSLREAMHWITKLFITPQSAPQILKSIQFKVYLFHLLQVPDFSLIEYLFYDCQFKPQFEHYQSIIDAAATAQPFHPILSTLTIPGLLLPLLQQDPTAPYDPYRLPPKGPLSATGCIGATLNITTDLPSGFAKQDVTDGFAVLQERTKTLSNDFIDMNFPYFVNNDAEQPTRKSGTTRLPPYLEIPSKAPTHAVYRSIYDSAQLPVLTTLNNSSKPATTHVTAANKLKALHSNTLITPREVLDTVINAYFNHQLIQIDFHRDSLFSIFLLFIRADTQFPTSLLPELPSEERFAEEIQRNADLKKKNKNKDQKDKEGTNEDNHPSDLVIQSPYFQVIQHYPREEKEQYHLANSLRIIHRVALTSGLRFFVQMFETAMEALYISALHRVFNAKTPQQEKLIFIPPPTVCTLQSLQHVFETESHNTHPYTFARRREMLEYCLTRLFSPLVDQAAKLITLQSEENTKVLAESGQRNDDESDSDDQNHNKKQGGNKKSSNKQQVVNKKKKEKGSKKAMTSTKTPLPALFSEQYITLSNEINILMNIIAIVCAASYDNEYNLYTIEKRIPCPYHLFATLFNYMPSITISPVFWRQLQDYIDVDDDPSFMLNLIDQYLGLWFKTHPDEISRKHGMDAYIVLNIDPNDPKRPHQVTTMLRQSSNLFNPSFSGKLQPLWYIKYGPPKFFINYLHICLLHCLDITSMVDIHGEHFDQFAIRSTILNQNSTDMAFFISYYNRIVDHCKKLNQNKNNQSIVPTTSSEESSQNNDKKTVEIDLPDDEIATPTPINALGIMKDNVLISWLKGRYQHEMKDPKRDESITMNDKPVSDYDEMSDIEFANILKDKFTKITGDLDEMKDSMTYISNKAGINSIMTTVGANHSVVPALSYLKSNYLPLFQKDAFGRTFLHHMAQGASYNMLPTNYDDAKVYQDIYNTVLTTDPYYNVSSSSPQPQKKGSKSSSPSTALILAPNPLSPPVPIQDNRLIMSHPSLTPLPVDMQQHYREFQREFDKYNRALDLAKLSNMPLPPSFKEPNYDEFMTRYPPQSFAEYFSELVAGQEDYFMVLEEQRVNILLDSIVNDIKANREQQQDGDNTIDLPNIGRSKNPIERENELAQYYSVAALEPTHPLYQTFEDLTPVLDSLLCIASISLQVTTMANDLLYTSSGRTNIDTLKKNFATDDFNPFIITQTSITDIQEMFTRANNGELPLVSNDDPDSW